MEEKISVGSTFQFIAKGAFTLVSDGYTLISSDSGGVFYFVAISDTVTITSLEPYNLQMVRT